MTGSIQGPPFLSAYLTVEEAGHKYGGGQRAICIRGLKWTCGGQESKKKKGGGEQGIKRGGREREKRLMRIWGGEERITRDGLCHVKLPLSTHVLPLTLLSVDDTIVNHRGNRLQRFDLLNFRAGA